MTRRKPWEVSDELWAVIEPLLPKHERRFRYPGRKRIDDRKTLQGVLFVLYTGIQWEYLPQELGFGSGPTCWRRLAEWQEAGVWEELQRVLLDRLRAADRLDFSRVAVDASHVRAKRGRRSPKVGPSPVDRARPGSKHHVLTDAHGTPLRVSHTGGHRATTSMPVAWRRSAGCYGPAWAWQLCRPWSCRVSVWMIWPRYPWILREQPGSPA
ncbi:hypothetical protein GCM10010376_91430 [Streptomyces violaceusniger]